MRRFLVVAVVVSLMGSGAAWAGPSDPVSSSMRGLFEEMKAHAEAERTYREEKKKEVLSLESQIDQIRADAKAKGATKDPDSVKPLQVKRLNVLEEVAMHDVKASEEGVSFAQRKLAISKQNLTAFQQKKAEASKAIGS